MNTPDRHPRGPARGPRAGAGDAPGRRSRREHRGGAVPRGADPGGQAGRAARGRAPHVGRRHRTAAGARSRSSSPAPRAMSSPTACSRPCCSPTSSARPSEPRRSATEHGPTSRNATTRVVRAELERYRGREVDTAGDGFLATFDGPARAIRCACAMTAAVRELGPRDPRRPPHRRGRAIDGDIGGIAVNIGARVARAGRPVRGPGLLRR